MSFIQIQCFQKQNANMFLFMFYLLLIKYLLSLSKQSACVIRADTSFIKTQACYASDNNTRVGLRQHNPLLFSERGAHTVND